MKSAFTVDESILNSVKKSVSGLTPEYTQFDQDFITNINSVFMILTQLGVGPQEGFSIEDSSAVWSDFISDSKDLKGVKSYMNMKVKLMFDPPLSSSVIAVLERLTSEFEWRLNTAAET